MSTAKGKITIKASDKEDLIKVLKGLLLLGDCPRYTTITTRISDMVFFDGTQEEEFEFEAYSDFTYEDNIRDMIDIMNPSLYMVEGDILDSYMETYNDFLGVQYTLISFDFDEHQSLLDRNIHQNISVLKVADKFMVFNNEFNVIPDTDISEEDNTVRDSNLFARIKEFLTK